MPVDHFPSTHATWIDAQLTIAEDGDRAAGAGDGVGRARLCITGVVLVGRNSQVRQRLEAEAIGVDVDVDVVADRRRGRSQGHGAAYANNGRWQRAVFAACGVASNAFSSLVLPLQRNPVITVIGIRLRSKSRPLLVVAMLSTSRLRDPARGGAHSHSDAPANAGASEF
jgi:hypothetical protein